MTTDENLVKEAKEMNKKTITELSKATLKSYIKKAKVSSKDQFEKEVDHTIKAVVTPSLKKYHSNQAKDASRKYNNRLKGYNKAYDKLAKEETLDEVSKEMKQRWLDKAVSKHYDMWKTAPKKKLDTRRTSIQKVSKELTGKKHFSDYIPKTKQFTNEETLDELSKPTLKSYIKKSADERKYYRGDELENDADKKRYAKRSKGYALAYKKYDKLAKEETLDELSKPTLMNYMQKSEADYYKTNDKKKKTRRLQGTRHHRQSREMQATRCSLQVGVASPNLHKRPCLVGGSKTGRTQESR
jgi:hypothetical protein